jgi:hypothetical protein
LALAGVLSGSGHSDFSFLLLDFFARDFSSALRSVWGQVQAL